MNNAEQLDFSEIGRALWPSLTILKADGTDARTESILAEVAARLRVIQARMEDQLPPERLCSPAPTGEVLNWLNSVWRELISAESRKQPDRKRALVLRILDSRLSTQDQSRLFTALDYLSRLAEASVVARSVRQDHIAEAPSIRSNAMQSAYRKLTFLAGTSLPIWLAGEKGTELDWMAHLAHIIGGARAEDLHFRDFSRHEGVDVSFGTTPEPARRAGIATLVARSADRAPQHVQQQLHNYLVGQLAGRYDTRIIVTSEPIDLTNGAEKALYLDLFAFLYPTMVYVPPLRNRVEDIEPLMAFLASKRNVADAVPRLTTEALRTLQTYHWPRNVEELESVTRFFLERKPVGQIGLGDLPESVIKQRAVPNPLLDALREIHQVEGFRILATEARRSDIATFLTEPHGSSFGALDFMKAFNQGRETSRRILSLFVSRGLVEGIKGATGQRTTRYRRVAQRGTADGE